MCVCMCVCVCACSPDTEPVDGRGGWRRGRRVSRHLLTFPTSLPPPAQVSYTVCQHSIAGKTIFSIFKDFLRLKALRFSV